MTVLFSMAMMLALGLVSWMHPMKDACPLYMVKSEFQGYNANDAPTAEAEMEIMRMLAALKTVR